MNAEVLTPPATPESPTTLAISRQAELLYSMLMGPEETERVLSLAAKDGVVTAIVRPAAQGQPTYVAAMVPWSTWWDHLRARALVEAYRRRLLAGCEGHWLVVNPSPDATRPGTFYENWPDAVEALDRTLGIAPPGPMPVDFVGKLLAENKELADLLRRALDMATGFRAEEIVREAEAAIEAHAGRSAERAGVAPTG